MATSKDSIQISAQSVMLDLECLICMEVPTKAPIYQCEEGHILCEECYELRKGGENTCPTCKVTLSGIRCRMAEKLLSKLPSRCRYSNGNSNGCEVELMSDDLAKHEKVCSHRPIACLDLQCREEIKIMDFVKHLEEHEITDQPTDTTSVTLPDYEKAKSYLQCPSTHFKVEEDDFYLVLVRTKKGLWYLWICGVPAQVSEKYKYKIEMKSENLKERYEYQGECSSLDLHPVKTMIKDGFCRGLMFNDSIIEKFKTSDGNLNLKIKIVRSDLPDSETPTLASNSIETLTDSNGETSQTESDASDHGIKQDPEKPSKKKKKRLEDKMKLKMKNAKGKLTPKKKFLSNDLAFIVGKNKASKKFVEKQMWAYIRRNNLHDPANQQFAICDDKLRAVIGKKRLMCRVMRRYFDAHMFDTYQDEDKKEVGGKEEENTTKEETTKTPELIPIKIRSNKDLFEDSSRDEPSSNNVQSDFVPLGKILWCDQDELAIIEEIRKLCEQEEDLKQKMSQDSQNRAKINVKATPMAMSRTFKVEEFKVE